MEKGLSGGSISRVPFFGQKFRTASRLVRVTFNMTFNHRARTHEMAPMVARTSEIHRYIMRMCQPLPLLTRLSRGYVQNHPCFPTIASGICPLNEMSWPPPTQHLGGGNHESTKKSISAHFWFRLNVQSKYRVVIANYSLDQKKAYASSR